MEDKANHILEEIEILYSHAKYGKDRHFSAAGRKGFYNSAFGVAVVFINVLIGSTIIKFFGSDQQAITSILSFTAASLAGIHAFFNFQKAVENHRRVGNLYIKITKRARVMIAQYKDNMFDKETLSIKCDELTEKYLKVNEEAERCPAGEKDFARALKIRKKTREYKKVCQDDINKDG